MRDVFWTILIIWVIYKVYNAVKSNKTFIFQKEEYFYNEKKTTEKKKKVDDNEYTPYEEIK